MVDTALPITLRDPVQVAFLVKDICRTAETLGALFGIGPFRFEDWPPPGRPEFESYSWGQSTRWRLRLAFANLNNMELELIQCVEGASAFSECLAQRGEGFHHLLFELDDLDAAVTALASKGIEVSMAATGRRPGTRWVMLDTFDLLGYAIELRSKPGAPHSAAPSLA